MNKTKPKIYSFRIVPSFKFEIKDRQMVVSGEEKLRMRKWVLSHRDGDYLMHLEKKTYRRSNKQNAAFWALPVKIIYEETTGQWDDLDDVYHWLEDKFAPQKPVMVGKELRYIRGRLKDLDVNDFGEVYQKIQQWGSETLGVVIPDPDKDYFIKE